MLFRSKPYTIRGETQQLRQLAFFGPSVAIGAIQASIRNGWQGLFPEKAAQTARTPQPTASERRQQYAAETLADALGITEDSRNG